MAAPRANVDRRSAPGLRDLRIRSDDGGGDDAGCNTNPTDDCLGQCDEESIMYVIPSPPRRRRRLGAIAFIVALASIVLGVTTVNAQSASTPQPTTRKPTIVLVHGAFADAS